MAIKIKTLALAGALVAMAAPAFAQVPPAINPLGIDLDPLHIFSPAQPAPMAEPAPMMHHGMMMHHHGMMMHHHGMMMHHHMMKKKMMKKGMMKKSMMKKDSMKKDM